MNLLLRYLVLTMLACYAYAAEIEKGEKYVIKRDDTVVFTTHKLAERYNRALEEGETPVFIGGSLTHVGGGGGITAKHEYKEDVLRAAGKKARRLKQGRKVVAVSEKDGVVCVQLNKRTKVYVWWDELMPLSDYETITSSTKPVVEGKAMLRNVAFLFYYEYVAEEYQQLAEADASAAVEWADDRRRSRDAVLLDAGVKFVVVEVHGKLAKIITENGKVLWCRCSDIAMR